MNREESTKLEGYVKDAIDSLRREAYEHAAEAAIRFVKASDPKDRELALIQLAKVSAYESAVRFAVSEIRNYAIQNASG